MSAWLNCKREGGCCWSSLRSNNSDFYAFIPVINLTLGCPQVFSLYDKTFRNTHRVNLPICHKYQYVNWAELNEEFWWPHTLVKLYLRMYIIFQSSVLLSPLCIAHLKMWWLCRFGTFQSGPYLQKRLPLKRCHPSSISCNCWFDIAPQVVVIVPCIFTHILHYVASRQPRILPETWQICGGLKAQKSNSGFIAL